MRTETRPWGRFQVLYETDRQWLKKIYIAPGQSLSLQSHEHRDETWVTEDEGVKAVIGNQQIDIKPLLGYHVPAGVKHRLINSGQDEVLVLEWAHGAPDEADIIRYEDDYGR